MTWSDALDALERTLCAQHAALERGELEAIVSFEPPAGLGPLPRDLLPRAAALLVQSQALTDTLRTRAAATQREIALLGKHRPAASSPSYVDSAV